MARWYGGTILATIQRPQRSGTPTVLYTGVKVQLDQVAPFTPGAHVTDRGEYADYMAYIRHPKPPYSPYDIRIGDQIVDPGSTDPVTGKATMWVVRDEHGLYGAIPHLELLCTLASAIR